MATKKCLQNSGNIAIIVAISLTVLIGILAIIIDGGYLYASKNKWQNGVEAAAMAGVWHMCDDDFEAVARQIAQENGLPSTVEDGLAVQIGYYDAGGLYDDFSEYKDFEADPDPDTSLNETVSTEDDPVYNNAVMVFLNADVSTFLAGIFGKDEVQVSAQAVAYAKSYGIYSFSENDEISVQFMRDGFPEFENCDIHSNNDIRFESEPDLNGSNVTAAGEITGCPDGIFPVEKISIKPIDWDELKQRAEENGAVLTFSDFEGYTFDNPNIINGNRCSNPGRNYVFELKEGDHNNAVYYFESEGIPSPRVIYMGQFRPPASCYSVTNLTIASEIKVKSIGLQPPYSHPYLGGEDDDVVFIFCKENIEFIGTSIRNQKIKGVVFRTEGDLMFDFGTVKNYDYVVYARFMADGKITIKRGQNYPYPAPEVFLFSTKFAPPCPPIGVRLGKLEPAGT